eukprot:CAMPEP_0113936068 /NCGR_PEP_ID=MMETSP1339-20121228/3059_1 /TAXON_ID=94617 /ORGANISM="Fibrocapsa japonica" /LENGTH=209 /DNA_ID=CAMNT_0000938407 /DNA_START=196 /DNA_END=825 /DNA_ORIENTATION=+ /assembly_acc=CAM_ASM_000762
MSLQSKLASRTDFVKILATGSFTTAFLSNTAASNALGFETTAFSSNTGFGKKKPTKPLEECLESVALVQLTTKQLEDDITNGQEIGDIPAQAQLLLRNYKLEENLRQGVQYLESNAERVEATKYAKEALEDLILITEYFPESYDNFTGKRLPSSLTLTPEKIKFSVKALSSNTKALEGYLSTMPVEMVAKVKQSIAEDMAESEASGDAE